jgi:hypothetical protein
MPILRSFDNKRNLVTLACSGAIAKGGIREAYCEMLDDPAFRPGANILWDFRGARGEPPSEQQIIDYVAMVKENQMKRGSNYKVAMIVDKDLHYGLIRMFQAYADTLPFEVMSFSTEDDAYRWLDETNSD